MNLQKSRVLFALTAAGFLVLCNLAYLYANSQNRQPAFAAQMDQPPIQMLSLLILIGVVVFAAIPDKDQGDQS
jgi:hypothetical protein